MEDCETLEDHSTLVTSVAVSPDGQIAPASLNKTIRLWNVITSKERKVLDSHSISDFLPDGQVVVSGLAKSGRR